MHRLEQSCRLAGSGSLGKKHRHLLAGPNGSLQHATTSLACRLQLQPSWIVDVRKQRTTWPSCWHAGYGAVGTEAQAAAGRAQWQPSGSISWPSSLTYKTTMGKLYVLTSNRDLFNLLACRIWCCGLRSTSSCWQGPMAAFRILSILFKPHLQDHHMKVA